MSLVGPPRWTTAEFDEQRDHARQIFRNQRLSESQGAYAESFAECLGFVNELLGKTDDLSRLVAPTDSPASDPELLDVLADPNLLEALRYVVGPPVSADDLAELSDTSLAPRVLRDDPGFHLSQTLSTGRGHDRSGTQGRHPRASRCASA